MVLLHGTLDLEIVEAHLHRAHILGLHCNPIAAVGNKQPDGPHLITVHLGPTELGRTRIIKRSAHPVWSEHWNAGVAHEAEELEINLWREYFNRYEWKLGHAHVPVAQLLTGKAVDDWFTIRGRLGGTAGRIHLRMQFTRAEDEPWWGRGLGQDGRFGEVPHTYFPMRRGCRATLYQNGEVATQARPGNAIAKVDGGRIEGRDVEGIIPHQALADMFDAIRNAKHFIYTYSWSFDHTLRSPPDNKQCPTIGEILKQKAEDGVTVCMILWDVMASTTHRRLKNKWLVHHLDHVLHNERAKTYFEGSKVCCVQVSRRAPNHPAKFFKSDIESHGFTHHQKTVICDYAALEGGSDKRRRLVVFTGGLDLTPRMMDTTEHPLDGWRGEEGGKENNRMPWHDVEIRVEGPAAWDFHTAFEQHWRLQVACHADRLLNVFKVDDLLTPNPDKQNDMQAGGDPAVMVTAEGDTACWHLQVLRSTDTGAVNFGFPVEEDVHELVWAKGLARGCHCLVERSCQNALIYAIRRARHFLFIQSQYFEGSSFAWDKVNDGYAGNLIPIEIALKVCSAIEKGERFAAYIVLPEHPDSKGFARDAILYWQQLTVKMMYRVVAQALRRKGSSAHPRDYLNFYCMAKTQPNSKKIKKSYIYVHAKMMIQDDEWIFLGSANFNQRSLDGSRDTEIAVGAHQPHHVCPDTPGDGGDKYAHGAVRNFRFSLWAEHLGNISDARYKDPATLECVQQVNRIADANWEAYASSDEHAVMKGNLMMYPYQISRNGQVTMLPGVKKFPMTKDPVMGRRHPVLAPKVVSE